MLHVDIPSRTDIAHLNAVRAVCCVSIYLQTSPVTQHAQQDRIEFKNLGRTALDQLRANDTEKSAVAAIAEAIDDLVDDDEFWRFQANSLAVLITPDATRTYRLPNRLTNMVEVSDRFHVKPLLRAMTVPQSAYRPGARAERGARRRGVGRPAARTTRQGRRHAAAMSASARRARRRSAIARRADAFTAARGRRCGCASTHGRSTARCAICWAVARSR